MADEFVVEYMEQIWEFYCLKLTLIFKDLENSVIKTNLLPSFMPLVSVILTSMQTSGLSPKDVLDSHAILKNEQSF